LAETTLNKNIQETYTNLKTKLKQQKCQIIAEDPPNTILAIQGSIWGTSPKTAQKKITYTIQQTPKGTNITNTSSLTSAYITFTVVGCVFSVALLALCIWIALDLQAYAANGVVVGFWGWLSQTGGQFDADKAAVFIRLSWILVTILVGSLSVEAYIIWKVHSGIGVFAQDMIKALQK
jgi:hypothetical protein